MTKRPEPTSGTPIIAPQPLDSLITAIFSAAVVAAFGSLLWGMLYYYAPVDCGPATGEVVSIFDLDANQFYAAPFQVGDQLELQVIQYRKADPQACLGICNHWICREGE